MKVAVLFPGYGSQFVGMGKEFYNDSRIVQEYFELASSCLDINFTKLCFASSDMELSKMGNANTALFLVGSAICALLKDAQIPFDMVAGYNHGEYTALFAADGISFPDGLYLLNKLSGFYQDVLNDSDIHAMFVSGILTQELSAMCATAGVEGEYVSIALYCTKVDHIISGSMIAVDKVKKMVAQHAHAKTHNTSVELGLHSPLFNGVADQFKMYLEKVDFKDLAVPLLSCSDGNPIVQGMAVKHHVIEHINSPVRWDKIMESCVESDIIIEVGPGTQLSGIITGMYPEKKVVSVNKSADIDTIRNMLNSHTDTGIGQ
ncbi:MAG: ACP S-malonyltransferase [Candidatus Dependentiae bacterium]|nr:ACP S-malonyltransferase [Candidatus Dependentiae bacterium]